MAQEGVSFSDAQQGSVLSFCDECLEVVTEENQHEFSADEVVHPSFTFHTKTQFPKNEIRTLMEKVAARYNLPEIGSMKKAQAASGFKLPTMDIFRGPRHIIVKPHNVKYHYEPEQKRLKLEFSLPSGAYATMALRELLGAPNCCGAEEAITSPVSPSLWQLGTDDQQFVPTYDEIYERAGQKLEGDAEQEEEEEEATGGQLEGELEGSEPRAEEMSNDKKQLAGEPDDDGATDSSKKRNQSIYPPFVFKGWLYPEGFNREQRRRIKVLREVEPDSVPGIQFVGEDCPNGFCELIEETDDDRNENDKEVEEEEKRKKKSELLQKYRLPETNLAPEDDTDFDDDFVEVKEDETNGEEEEGEVEQNQPKTTKDGPIPMTEDALQGNLPHFDEDPLNTVSEWSKKYVRRNYYIHEERKQWKRKMLFQGNLGDGVDDEELSRYGGLGASAASFHTVPLDRNANANAIQKQLRRRAERAEMEAQNDGTFLREDGGHGAVSPSKPYHKNAPHAPSKTYVRRRDRNAWNQVWKKSTWELFDRTGGLEVDEGASLMRSENGDDGDSGSGGVNLDEGLETRRADDDDANTEDYSAVYHSMQKKRIPKAPIPNYGQLTHAEWNEMK